MISFAKLSKEHALGNLTQLYTFTGLKVFHDNSDAQNQQKHDSNYSTQLLDSKSKETKNNTPKTFGRINNQKPQKQKIN